MMPAVSNRTKTIIAILIALLTWSSAYPLIRVALHDFSPGTLALFRYLISSLVMLVLYANLPKRNKPTIKEGLHLFIIGAIGIGAYMIFLNYGELTVSASITSFIIGMSPIVSLLWVRATMKETISNKRWLGIGISVFGLFIIMISKYRENTLDWHIIFIIIATCCGGFYNVAQKPLLKKFHPIEVATFSAWAATITMLIFFPQLIRELPRMPTHTIGVGIYLAIASGCIGYGCWTYAMSGDIPASKLVPTIYTLPLLSTMLAWFILGEIPTPIALTGGIIALFGAIIATK